MSLEDFPYHSETHANRVDVTSDTDKSGTLQAFNNRIGIESNVRGLRTIRTFHVSANAQLTNKWQLNGLTDTNKLQEATDEQTRSLVVELLNLLPVKEIVELKPRLVTVQIHPMHFWNEVHDDIIEAILQRTGWTHEDTVILSYDEFQVIAADSDRTLLPKN